MPEPLTEVAFDWDLPNPSFLPVQLISDSPKYNGYKMCKVILYNK